VADALRVAAEDAARGVPLVAAVERMADRAAAGPELRPLVSTLVVAAGSGTPVGPALQRLADAERRRRRRAVEARIRRLPVLLLLPLVLCVLPAFVLMTLVPVGLAAARGTADAVPGALAPRSDPPPHLLPLVPAPVVGPVPGAHP
jgi:hypothetical protein